MRAHERNSERMGKKNMKTTFYQTERERKREGEKR